MEEGARPAEIAIKCPICGKKAKARFLVYNVPHFGEVLLSSVECPYCGFKSSDVIIPKEGNPKKYKLVVDSPRKLNSRIIKSSTCDIKIPELGIEIHSTNFSEGFITNVDGLLMRIEEVIDQLFPRSRDERVRELIEKLKKAERGEIRFTIILEDKSGNSAIIERE